MNDNFESRAEQILVSIILPVYNVEPYIKQCIASIINQTYQHWELIIVDDASPDKCGRIADEYAVLDCRIRVVHQENKGLGGARNTALDLAKGEYICFVDSDDYIEPEYIEKLVFYVDRSTIVCCGYRLFSDNRLDIKSIPTQQCYDRVQFIDFLLSGELSCRIGGENLLGNYMWNKIYPKECFNGVRFWEGRAFEDISITMQLFSKVDKFIIIPDVIYNYRIRDNSIVHTITIKNDLDYFDALLVQEQCLSHYETIHNKVLQLIELAYVKQISNRAKSKIYSVDENVWKYIVEKCIEVLGVERFIELEAKKLSELHSDIVKINKQKKELDRRLKNSNKHLNDVKSGLSFKIGRIITWLPRKLLGRK